MYSVHILHLGHFLVLQYIHDLYTLHTRTAYIALMYDFVLHAMVNNKGRFTVLNRKILGMMKRGTRSPLRQKEDFHMVFKVSVSRDVQPIFYDSRPLINRLN